MGAAQLSATGGKIGARSGAEDSAAGVSTGADLDAAMAKTQAKAALTSLGWKPAIAGAAVAAAVAALGADVPLEELIVESLRRCPMPRA